MGVAKGSTRGSAEYNLSTSVSKNNQSALTKLATKADKVSLSPNFNSSVATVSFSLTIGITPKSNKALKVLLTLT